VSESIRGINKLEKYGALIKKQNIKNIRYDKRSWLFLLA
jgi:hypothetical protein